MKSEISLPKDELPHPGQAIEWWYFNGFLKGKGNYAFMHCLFKADTSKVNLAFLKMPVDTVFFSHSLLFNLDSGEVKKEILPAVILSEDSFSREELFLNYFFPVRKGFVSYEISRLGGDLRLKNRLLDLRMVSRKKPLLEGGTGLIDLGQKSTYYFSYSNLDADGFVGDDRVRGKAWYDRQWSRQGFMKDSWLWFSFQLDDDTEIVCFDYKGKRMASISHLGGSQESFEPKFEPLGHAWKSARTGLEYVLDWKITIGKIILKTRPILRDCEMNFGTINYWEGPVLVEMDGGRARGFMEYLAQEQPIRTNAKNLFRAGEKMILKRFGLKENISILGKRV